MRRLLASAVTHECRTTWHAGLFSVVDTLANAGVTRWTLPECRAPGATIWEQTTAQVARLGARFAGFVVRRG